MVNEDRACLEHFVMGNEDLDQLEALLAEFNIFEAVGVVRQELRHSDLLAFLLDPSQNHGLGDVFLKRLLKRVLVGAAGPPLSVVEVDAADLRNAEVQREWRNIDILVQDASNRLVCAIENKIDTGEHSDQLGRYRQEVARAFPTDRRILVFLTPEGIPGSDQAYIPFSYIEVARLLDAVRQAHLSTLKPDVSTFMAHYATMLRRHIVSDSEIAELCRKIYGRHRRALDLIFEHRPDRQSELADAIKGMIEESAAAYGLELEDSLKSYIRFAVKDWDRFPGQKAGKGWTNSQRILLFVVDNLVSGLSLGLHIGPGPEPIRQAMAQATEGHPNVLLGSPKPRAGKWITIYERRLASKADLAKLDLKGLQAKLRTRWQEFLTEDLPVIHKAITGIDWPAL